MILNIDTALESATIAIGKEGTMIAAAENLRQQDHAAWLHKAINNLLQETGCAVNDLKAVAVTEGPGSYTGLRVGMASAKGLCYALNIPLITVGTLKLMAASAMADITESAQPKWVAPLIDARRQEVFAAIYDDQLKEVMTPQAMILEKNSFSDFLDKNALWFLGSGAAKWQKQCEHPNAKFLSSAISPAVFCNLTYDCFLRNDFATLAYTEPVYLKDFYTHPKK
jgi:tRNA threonylcarbamoyladenosine biosynthesis protein TsaB